jgi:hypothetical protein
LGINDRVYQAEKPGLIFFKHTNAEVNMIQTCKAVIKKPISLFYPVAAVIAFMIAFSATNARASENIEKNSLKFDLRERISITTC